MSIDRYTVALAHPNHIAMIPRIERAAAALFPADVITPEARNSTVPTEELASACAEARLWTAVTTTGTPVGFAIAIHESDSGFLQEIDVLPEHQRRGLGRQLLQHVVDWAGSQGFSTVTLTTFEHVSWNAPFYSRFGFRITPEHELNPTLRQRLRDERERGLRDRVAMQLDLKQ